MSFKVFVIGKSQSGKTTFSKAFCNKFGFQHIQASEWIKSKNKHLNPVDVGYRKEITELTVQALRKNQNACVNFIKRKYDLSLPTLIEGIRNPHDFHNLFDYQRDYVIFLHDSSADVTYPMFDFGVKAIQTSITFMLLTKIMDKNNVIYEIFHKDDSVYNQASKAVDYYNMTDQDDLCRL